MTENARNSRDFCIKLASGASWRFVSTSETNEWLNKLCSIMELNESMEVEGPKIIFLRNIFKEYNLIKSLNLNEISMWNTGPLRIYQCKNASHMICEIGDVDFPGMQLLKLAQSVF